MKWFLLGVAAISLILFLGVNYGLMDNKEENKIDTVDQLEIEKYLGKWYAVAGITKFFNESCAWGNMAQYSLREDGRIDVLNSCYTQNGEKREVRAVAWRPDESEPGKLKVSFLPLFNYRLFAADYWVIELGDDYEYAVVGHPTRNFGWILNREPIMKEQKLQAILARLERAGYDPSDFKINPQSPPQEQGQ